MPHLLRTLTEQERLHWLRLIRSESIGPKSFAAMLSVYKTAEKALEVLPELARRSGRRKNLRIYSQAQAEKELQQCAKQKVRLVALCEPDYPPLLRMIEDAPPIIAIKGRTELLQRPMVGMVGSRHASTTGLQMAKLLAENVGRSGYIIASGLARGIDTAAHKAALGSGTVAVVAGGIDHIYPPENKALHARIAEEGVIVAELPLGSIPKAQHFPRRNRIISGMAQGVVVVEAGLRSGSLITARMALEQGREVFAVPGSPLDSRCQGANRLLKQGAQLVESAEDITGGLRGMEMQEAGQGFWHQEIEEEALLSGMFTDIEEAPQEETPLPPAEEAKDARGQLLEKLSATPVEIDNLVAATGLSVPTVLTLLLELELGGRLTRHSGNRVALVVEEKISSWPEFDEVKL